jgi:hypothetical protein
MDRKTNAWSKIHHISQKTTNSGPPEGSTVSAPFEAPAVLLLNDAKIDPISAWTNLISVFGCGFGDIFFIYWLLFQNWFSDVLKKLNTKMYIWSTYCINMI